MFGLSKSFEDSQPITGQNTRHLASYYFENPSRDITLCFNSSDRYLFVRRFLLIGYTWISLNKLQYTVRYENMALRLIAYYKCFFITHHLWLTSWSLLTYIFVNIWTCGICQVLSLAMSTTNCILNHKTYTMWNMLICWNIATGQWSLKPLIRWHKSDDGDFSG